MSILSIAKNLKYTNDNNHKNSMYIYWNLSYIYFSLCLKWQYVNYCDNCIWFNIITMNIKQLIHDNNYYDYVILSQRRSIYKTYFNFLEHYPFLYLFTWQIKLFIYIYHNIILLEDYYGSYCKPRYLYFLHFLHGSMSC